ncbi:DUF6578 domain-containing protein [Klenkia taihuensis]|uniref:Uncharacterized protein n=1 Tax=Klenkia taihuensis TaxID=1225127 RepID=A0A1I1V473_9ACTN|nr:DUF6578 domain-containing protein [Klenkia taihuensis]GHE14539.1 hypothetical protein GCM10011381_41540 [Klenkia taihuensis]SFD77699.1 hypothetical protein SAMN05661030_4200 [Klenkia taihuensis]
MTTRVLQVLVEEWELGCCGGPVHPGDRVEWSLTFSDRVEDAAGALLTETWLITDLPSASLGWSASLLTSGSVQAAWAADGGRTLPIGTHQMTGYLVASWHGGGVVADPPVVGGVVERIRVVEQRYELVHTPPADRPWAPGPWARGVFVPVPASAELTAVEVADGRDSGHALPAPGDTSYRTRSGWLVDLAVER